MQKGRVLTVSVALVFSIACGGSPTEPSERQLARVTLSMGFTEVVDGYQVQASAYVADNVYRDVTGLATWSTSDTSIATVNSVGFVTAHRAGSVAVRASYENASGFVTIDVVPGGLRRYYRAVSGWIRDSADENQIKWSECPDRQRSGRWPQRKPVENPVSALMTIRSR